MALNVLLYVLFLPLLVVVACKFLFRRKQVNGSEISTFPTYDKLQLSEKLRFYVHCLQIKLTQRGVESKL